MNEQDIVCVATTPNRTQAHSWKSALEAEGIMCQVGEDLTFWFDNRAGAQADLWVHRFNAQRALEILEHNLVPDSALSEAVGQH